MIASLAIASMLCQNRVRFNFDQPLGAIYHYQGEFRLSSASNRKVACRWVTQLTLTRKDIALSREVYPGFSFVARSSALDRSSANFPFSWGQAKGDVIAARNGQLIPDGDPWQPGATQAKLILAAIACAGGLPEKQVRVGDTWGVPPAERPEFAPLAFPAEFLSPDFRLPLKFLGVTSPHGVPCGQILLEINNMEFALKLCSEFDLESGMCVVSRISASINRSAGQAELNGTVTLTYTKMPGKSAVILGGKG
jgi:hypothetical protein